MLYLQLVAIPNPVPVQQSETVTPKSPTMAIQPSTPAGELQVKLEQCQLAEKITSYFFTLRDQNISSLFLCLMF